MTHHVTLFSPLDPLALARALKAAVTDHIDASTPAGVLGYGSERELTLWYYRPKLRNSLQAGFSATIAAEGSGSRIEGRIGTPFGPLAFMGCWLSFVSLFLVGGVILFVSAPQLRVALWPFVLVPGLMATVGIVATRGGLKNRRADEAAILAFLNETVQAHPQ